MDELIRYFQTLESRISAYEKRIALLEDSLAEKQQLLDTMREKLDVLHGKFDALQTKFDTAQQQLLNTQEQQHQQQTEEEEVEVELIYPEDEEEQVEVQVNEEHIPEPEVEPKEPEEQLQNTIEPKKEQPRMPLQTSLFGTAVTDIRQAVSIGDRFLFQRELFGGSAEKLQQTLTELNNLNSLDEALTFVDRLGWDKQSTTYELFINVLHRRFQ